VFHGKGGYDWITVYNMPIWLRKYTFGAINQYHKEMNEQNQDNQSTPNNVAKGPDISPSYSTKASK